MWRVVRLWHGIELTGGIIVGLGVGVFYGGLALLLAVVAVCAPIHLLSGSLQLVDDIALPALDSSAGVGDAVSVPMVVGTLVVLAAIALLAGFGVVSAKAIEGFAAGGRLTWPRTRPRTRAVVAAAAVAAGCLLWELRVPLHGLAMLFYEYPLVTWIPVVLAALVTLGVALVRGRSSLSLLLALSAVFWLAFMAALPSWQGRALYDATRYAAESGLPASTQPRLLPKVAATAYGSRDGMRHAHVTVDAATGRLVWTAEHKPGLVPRGASDGIAIQPLDRVDGTVHRIPAGFDPAVSRVGPGSLTWIAYQRHYFTRVQDPVIVPLADEGAVAIAPYIGYRGFPVRRPYWQGVYVLHQDGRLEDLTPRQAMARPELVRSGRLFPERLARDVAEAYGYRTGAAADLLGRDRTVISDAAGNSQPYLTNFYDGQVLWVTVAHTPEDPSTLSAVFLTDASSGRTAVWHPPPAQRLLSNVGAAKRARRLPLQWDTCCDDNDGDYDIRRVTEPRPVFANGLLYYLVSIVPINGLETPEPVDRTVLIDAAGRRIVHVYDHAYPGADDRLRAFFRSQ